LLFFTKRGEWGTDLPYVYMLHPLCFTLAHAAYAFYDLHDINIFCS
jgi:hypothetical protein